MKIYLASSWRNRHQPEIVAKLRAAGHEVYDFRNPVPGKSGDGFAWSSIDQRWQEWSPRGFREALEHPTAQHGFRLDMDALRACDACVLLLPCGRSAHLELGWAAGAAKRSFALVLDELGPHEPELMYKMLDRVCVTVEELLHSLDRAAWGMTP